MVVFLHIAKTAGTSLHSSLVELLQPQAPCPYLTDDDVRKASSLDAYDYLHGHFTMHCIRRLVPWADIVTMLRNPVTRALSQYQGWHAVLEPDPVWEEHLARHDAAAQALAFTQRATIHEFFNSERAPIQRQFTNYQTYFLSDYDVGTTEFRVWDEAALRSAKNNLIENVRVFGIAERMAESLGLIKTTFGKPDAKLEPVILNRSRRPSGELLDLNIVRRIESHNPMDLELYAFAMSEFERRISGLESKTAR
jgi:hypothetical protein